MLVYFSFDYYFSDFLKIEIIETVITVGDRQAINGWPSLLVWKCCQCILSQFWKVHLNNIASKLTEQEQWI